MKQFLSMISFILVIMNVAVTANNNYLTEEITMQDRKVIQKPTKMIIGIECRTSNAPDAGPHDIPRHWEKFYTNNILNKIPNKTSNEVIALYCDYEGDYTQPYSLVIGCEVSTVDEIPEGKAEDYPEARKPAYKLEIDFGPLGKKRSSAQITHHYTKEDLLGKQIIAVVNFPPKQIGKFVSEVLTLGLPNENGTIILTEPTTKVPNGSRLF